MSGSSSSKCWLYLRFRIIRMGIRRDLSVPLGKPHQFILLKRCQLSWLGSLSLTNGKLCSRWDIHHHVVCQKSRGGRWNPWKYLLVHESPGKSKPRIWRQFNNNEATLNLFGTFLKLQWIEWKHSSLHFDMHNANQHCCWSLYFLVVLALGWHFSELRHMRRHYGYRIWIFSGIFWIIIGIICLCLWISFRISF